MPGVSALPCSGRCPDAVAVAAGQDLVALDDAPEQLGTAIEINAQPLHRRDLGRASPSERLEPSTGVSRRGIAVRRGRPSGGSSDGAADQARGEVVAPASAHGTRACPRRHRPERAKPASQETPVGSGSPRALGVERDGAGSRRARSPASIGAPPSETLRSVVVASPGSDTVHVDGRRARVGDVSTRLTEPAGRARLERGNAGSTTIDAASAAASVTAALGLDGGGSPSSSSRAWRPEARSARRTKPGLQAECACSTSAAAPASLRGRDRCTALGQYRRPARRS